VALSPTPLVKSFAYNAIGNLTAKSDVGTYTYPAAGQPRPHAVTSARYRCRRRRWSRPSPTTPSAT
jgi:hypothetical protein